MKRRSRCAGSGEGSSTPARARSIATPLGTAPSRLERAGRAFPPALLASVASAGEAATALEGGAEIVDLKDPRRGPLGPCSARTLAAARRTGLRLDPARPMSAALGPARCPRTPRRAASAARLGYAYVKCGLEGLADLPAAVRALRAVARAARAASPQVQVIAAGFADAERIRSLPWRLLPEAAARAGVDGCLLDTAGKDGRSLSVWVSPRDLAAFVADCRRRGLLCALAGSIAANDLPAIVALGADIIGARGALCDGGRTGWLSAERLRIFRAALHRSFETGSTPPVRRPPARRSRSATGAGRAGRRSPAAPAPPPPHGR